MTSRKAAQTAAVIALLQSLEDQQLEDVLTGLNTKGVVVMHTPSKRPARPCGICHEYYLKCRRLWSSDHEFEGPTTTTGVPE